MRIDGTRLNGHRRRCHAGDGADIPKMPDWQFGGSAGYADYRPALAHEPFQQCVHRNTPPPRFISQQGLYFA